MECGVGTKNVQEKHSTHHISILTIYFQEIYFTLIHKQRLNTVILY